MVSLPDSAPVGCPQPVDNSVGNYKSVICIFRLSHFLASGAAGYLRRFPSSRVARYR